MAVQRDKVIANAEKLVAKGKIEPAIKEYERLLEDSPNDVNTLNRIGDLWVRVNNNDEAVKVFSKIADHYSKDGFFLKAIAIFKKINKLDPSKLEIYAKLADLYAKQGLAMEAKSQYQVLADYYLKHGEPANALAIYRKISELDPQSINVHVKLADLYSQNNQTAEALKEYDRVGRLLLKRGMLDEAVQVFRKALKIDPKNTELVDSLVTALLEAKDFDNAQQIVDAALEANANNPRLLGMLGRIQLGRGDNAGARATLERAVAADPNEPSTREAMADLYLKQNDADRALEMIAPLVERALAKGERGTAIEMLNRILRVESGHTPTLERLVAVYSRLNEETNILASMSSLAEAHVSRMHFDEAAKVLEKLIQREPQNAQHRNKLQFVRSQMGGLDTVPARGGRTAPPVESAADGDRRAGACLRRFRGAGDDFSLEIDSSPALDLGSPKVDVGRAPCVLRAHARTSSADASRSGGGDRGRRSRRGRRRPRLHHRAPHRSGGLFQVRPGRESRRASACRPRAGTGEPDRATSGFSASCSKRATSMRARAAAQAYVSDPRGQGATARPSTAVKNEFASRGERFESAPTPEPIPSFASESSISIDDFARRRRGDELRSRRARGDRVRSRAPAAAPLPRHRRSPWHCRRTSRCRSSPRLSSRRSSMQGSSRPSKSCRLQKSCRSRKSCRS